MEDLKLRRHLPLVDTVLARNFPLKILKVEGLLLPIVVVDYYVGVGKVAEWESVGVDIEICGVGVVQLNDGGIIQNL